MLTATDQKLQKSLKRWYYSASRWHSGNMMVGNITFLMIFAVFDPSSLTLWINCSFFVLIIFMFDLIILTVSLSLWTVSGQLKAHALLTCTNEVSPNHLPVIVASDRPWTIVDRYPLTKSESGLSASRSCHLAGIASDCNNRFLLCHVLRTFSCLGPSGQRHYVFEMCMRRHSPPDLPSTCSFCIVWSSCTVS